MPPIKKDRKIILLKMISFKGNKYMFMI